MFEELRKKNNLKRQNDIVQIEEEEDGGTVSRNLSLSLAVSISRIFCHDLFILQIITICLSGSCLLHKLFRFFFLLLFLFRHLPAFFSRHSCSSCALILRELFPLGFGIFSLILFDLHTPSAKNTNTHSHREIYKHSYVNVFFHWLSFSSTTTVPSPFHLPARSPCPSRSHTATFFCVPLQSCFVLRFVCVLKASCLLTRVFYV